MRPRKRAVTHSSAQACRKDARAASLEKEDSRTPRDCVRRAKNETREKKGRKNDHNRHQYHHHHHSIITVIVTRKEKSVKAKVSLRATPHAVDPISVPFDGESAKKRMPVFFGDRRRKPLVQSEDEQK